MAGITVPRDTGEHDSSLYRNVSSKVLLDSYCRSSVRVRDGCSDSPVDATKLLLPLGDHNLTLVLVLLEGKPLVDHPLAPTRRWV